MNIFINYSYPTTWKESFEIQYFKKKKRPQEIAMPGSAEQEHFVFYFISSCFKLAGLEFVSSLDCKIYLCRKLLLECSVIGA